jgi:hypothetical protein
MKVLGYALSAPRRVAADLAVVIAVGMAVTAVPGLAGTPIGNRLGIASFATLHRAYRHTPGIEITVVSRGSKRAIFGHFLFQLRGGTVVAEEFVGSGSDPNRLVAGRGGPTHAWQAPGKCWRRVRSADPRTLTEVGLRYPYPRTGVKAMAPRRHGADVILTTEDSDKVWFLATQNVYRPTAKRILTYTIDARTHRIRSIAIQALKNGTGEIRPHRHSPTHWWTATLRVTTLTSAPHLPTALPTCN